MSNPSPDYLVAMRDMNYPFASPYVTADFNLAVSDLFLQLNAPEHVRLSGASVTDGDLRLQLEDDEGDPLLDTDEADEHETSAFGPWTVHTWVWPVNDGPGSAAILSVVFDTARLNALGSFNFQDMALGLQYRNVASRCARVESFEIEDEDLGSVELAGDVTLVAGTNVRLELDTEGVTIHAIPGAGQGKNPKDCEGSDNPIRSIGNVVADEFGNVSIALGACYTWTTFASAEMSFNGNCKTCFSCEDLDDVAAALFRQYERALNTRTRLARVIDEYYALLNQVNAFKGSLDETRVSLSVEQTSQTTAAVSVRLQAGNYIESGVAQAVTSLIASFSFSSGDVRVLEYSGKRKLPGLAASTWAAQNQNGTGFVYNGTPVIVLPNRYASWYYAIEVILPPSSDSTAVPVTVTGSATVQFANGTPLTFTLDPVVLAIVPPGVEGA
jgi:hypothetical protein